MSPIDPVSPSSPMSISPLTPSPTRYQFELPQRPVILPSIHLPRLRTSFQNPSSYAAHSRNRSVQFQLPTPSPLSLAKSPITAISRRSSTPVQTRSDVECLSATDLYNSPLAGLVLSTPGSIFPRSDFGAIGSATASRVSSLHRQNAMEGLAAMESGLVVPSVEGVYQLPLRPSARRLSDAARQISLDTQGLSEGKSTLLLAPASTLKHKRILPKTHGFLGKSLSPIHKRQRHRGTRSRIAEPIRIKVSPSSSPSDGYLKGSISHLRSNLVPLVSVRTGQSHPRFPSSLLAYHLLTHDQLDALARHYHQTVDSGDARWMYPCPIGWGKVWCGSTPAAHGPNTIGPGKKHLVDLDTKRRRWGRFIGLKGCESPAEEGEIMKNGQNQPRTVPCEAGETISERMDREWREALRKAEEEHMVREKMWGRRS